MSVQSIRTMSVAAALALSAILCSCSVKEDRSGCPCYVCLSVDDFIRAGFTEALAAFSQGTDSFREDMKLAEYAGGVYEKAFPRRRTRLSVLAGRNRSVVGGNTLTVPYGLEADPIWMFCGTLDCAGDEEHVRAVPYKQYCNLTIVLAGLSGGGGYGCELKLHASYGAMDIYSGAPLAVEYCATARKSADGIFSVRIPRQSDGNIFLEISGWVSPEGETIAGSIVDLGREFRESGYDWADKSLSDASAVVDFAGASVSLSVEDWDDDDSFEDIEI